MNSDVFVVFASTWQHVLSQVFTRFISELLAPVDVLLNSCARVPSAASGFRGLNFLDLLFDLVFQYHIGSPYHRIKGSLHRLDRDRLIEAGSVPARHAHQPRWPLISGRARAAICRHLLQFQRTGPNSSCSLGYLCTRSSHSHAFGDLRSPDS